MSILALVVEDNRLQRHCFSRFTFFYWPLVCPQEVALALRHPLELMVWCGSFFFCCCCLFQRPWRNVDWAFVDQIALEWRVGKKKKRKKKWRTCLVSNVIYTRPRTHYVLYSKITPNSKLQASKERQLGGKRAGRKTETRKERRDRGRREAERERE